MMLEGSARGLSTTALLLIAALLSSCGEGGSRAAADARSAETLPTQRPPTESSTRIDPTSSPARGTAWVVFGTEEDPDTVFAEVARTADERAEGLMYRESLGENAGMLFVFQDVDRRAFWMRNTFIPLDIAYMDPSFRIMNIEPMEPESDDFVESSGPAQYALEVNRGWFEAHGVVAGDAPRIFFGM